MNRYSLLLVITGVLAGLLSYTQGSDKTLPTVIFNTLIFSIPIGLFFLYIDYALTVLKKRQYIFSFYLLALFFSVSFLPFATEHSLLTSIRQIIRAGFFLTTAVITVYFYINTSHIREEDQKKNDKHPLHVLADTYERHKQSKEPWEAQIYDFFAEKIQAYRTKKLVEKNPKTN